MRVAQTRLSGLVSGLLVHILSGLVPDYPDWSKASSGLEAAEPPCSETKVDAKTVPDWCFRLSGLVGSLETLSPDY